VQGLLLWPTPYTYITLISRETTVDFEGKFGDEEGLCKDSDAERQ
jgi:hypothetical protein